MAVVQKIEITGDPLLARFGHTVTPGILYINVISWKKKNCIVWRGNW